MNRHDLVILRAIARAAFVSTWADRAEERGRRFPPGTELMDVAPKRTSPAANRWARHVAATLTKMNGDAPLSRLYEGVSIFYSYLESPDRFGHELGMQTMGHGICWHDSLPLGTIVRGSPIRMAYISFYGD